MFKKGLWTVCVAFSLCVMNSPAISERASSTKNKAEYFARIHAAAIYCRFGDPHGFGVAAIKYFKKRKNFESIRNAYGLALLNSTGDPPAQDIGGNCQELPRHYNHIWQTIKGEK
ncbi:MAG: hypothetical protein PSN37_01215 [Alphaproteobacteria bacterium]|nr:hypothetical protein [Alphaproteobacteria bacterium]